MRISFKYGSSRTKATFERNHEVEAPIKWERQSSGKDMLSTRSRYRKRQTMENWFITPNPTSGAVFWAELCLTNVRMSRFQSKITTFYTNTSKILLISMRSSSLVIDPLDIPVLRPSWASRKKNFVMWTKNEKHNLQKKILNEVRNTTRYTIPLCIFAA